MTDDNMIQVLDHGFVRLEIAAVSDLSVVNSARVSFGNRHTAMEDGDDKLIAYLLKHRHGTPFEHGMFTFHVKAPIFIFREWQRHRIGSFNEMSARYTELPGEWYVPDVKNVRRRVGKPGHYLYEPMDDGTTEGYLMAKEFVDTLAESCWISYRNYKSSLNIGIAPEQARLFLHVNHYSEMYWTVNPRSLMNFLNLRNAPTAQWEIQQYAQVVEKFFIEAMPETSAAFELNGRIAP